MKILKVIVVVLFYAAFADRPTRWCVSSNAEEMKCNQLKAELQKAVEANTTLATVLPADFQCIDADDVFSCMELIESDQADLVNLDSGLGYFAGRQHNMMPIMAEKYDTATTTEKPSLYSVAVMAAGTKINLNTLTQNSVCFSGIGMAAGWVYPIGTLLKNNYIEITECNALVKAVASAFGHMCLPGSLTSLYNQYGNNPTSVCELCTGQNEEFCSTSDTFAGYDGAFRCVAEGKGQLAYVRHDIFDIMQSLVNNSETSGISVDPASYQLLCPDGKTAAVTDYATCNWGQVTSNVILTSAVREPYIVKGYKNFLFAAQQLFGRGGRLSSSFQIFNSESSYPVDVFKRVFTRKNLMFSDTTQSLIDITETETYYSWVGDDFNDMLTEMNNCPSDVIRWCLISMAEKLKCEDMIMAFKAKELQPEMDCLYGGNTTACLEMIWRGDADLISLDAGDVYIAGRRYGLIPIASEDYGDMSMKFKAVAAIKKTDQQTTLFNLKAGRRSCHPGIGRGDGWVIPLNIFIETKQFSPKDCTIFRNIGELFSRSCIPGSLDTEYNPGGRPINLCEACKTNGYGKCQRNNNEMYYGTSGAFRCLVQNGGDIAFVRHLTVRDNTDGRNHATWARNRRSDDYELLCKDGRRLNVDRFNECHLGEVPADAIVTSAAKTSKQIDIIWNVLNYGQQYFSSDIDGDFHMFDSGFWYSNLIFNDAAVRLMKISPDRQNYKDWLGETFLAQVENLHRYTCVNPDSAGFLRPSFVASLLVVLVSMLLKHL
ncbi:melanotransferrin-like isoform X1 [Biomphalaria glabrata]|uniref:Melanotransferrin-like isoform X1 n=2 Tax=Biomphalaria glabrata TaxID=6526 RepID=A0A9W2YLQ1_BIOGL|nr:melanotransferrin-like isoform X1 [Biomphalaria glabrata]